MNTKFYICEHCGNIIEKIKDAKVPVICCGQKMTPLEAGVVDASREKHVPVVKVEGNVVRVEVGSVSHPMVQEHFIEWIYLETCCGIQRKSLNPESEPVAAFILSEGEKPLAVYAYCNLHGLWKTEI